MTAAGLREESVGYSAFPLTLVIEDCLIQAEESLGSKTSNKKVRSHLSVHPQLT